MSTKSSSTRAKSVSVTTATVIEYITIKPLTTTFTAPKSCGGKHLSQMSSPGFQIWLDEPNPVPGTIISDCYPSEFMTGYTSVYNESSSIAAYLSPLVCPDGWHTATTGRNGYIACCASGYLLAPPSTTVDTDRPAYGGTCYSDLKIGSTITVTQYDSVDVTGTASFAFPTSAQVYAHPIDGFMVQPVSSTVSQESVPSPASASSSAPSSTASSGESQTPPQLSGGAIAGIAVGSVAGFVLLLLAVLFLLRRRWQNTAAAIYNNTQGQHLTNGPKSVATWTATTISPVSQPYSPPASYGGNTYMSTTHSNQYELESSSNDVEIDSRPIGHGARG